MRRFLAIGSHSGTVVLAVAMLILIVAQLSWWLIFFQRNQSETAQLQAELDAERIAAAHRSESVHENLVRSADGTYALKSSLAEARDQDRRGAFFMLFTESLFVILVFSYGTFRVVRTISRERRLRHQRQMLIDSVTHELKTPLASILLNVQTILRRDPEAQTREELLRDCVDDIHRLEEQLNNILLSSRLGRQRRTDAEATGVNVRQLCEEYLRENGRRLEQQSELDLDLSALPADLSEVAIDGEAFRTILSNIVQNTAQYAGTGPVQLQLSALADAGRRFSGRREMRLYFQDSGPGIPREEWKTVFEAFYRLKGGDRPVRGSGIGLYLVRSLARAAGGDARIVAQPAGSELSGLSGLCLELRLPVAG